ncbi:MAG TPA: ATP-binding protein, partial [Vicinamibacterales bacterium]|nr:ATP-binding protein [Vicinamibacterales bacterium]
MDCEICHGTRWKSVTVDGVERLTRCDCWKAVVVQKYLAEAHIPPKFGRAELTTYKPDTDSQRDALRLAKKFVESFPVEQKGLVFHGPTGVGKTHLAIGILKAVIRDRGARGYFFQTTELLRLVRETYNRSVDETEMEVLRPVLEADVLVLDDLGVEKTSEWVQ